MGEVTTAGEVLRNSSASWRRPDISNPDPCPHCKADVGSWDLNEHECEEWKAHLKAELNREFEELKQRLGNPDKEAIRSVLSDTRLPARTFPGLRHLERTDTNAAAIDAAQSLICDFQDRKRSRGIYFYGPLGTGKTAILSALGFDLRQWTGAHRSRNRELLARRHKASEPWLVGWGAQAKVQFWTVPDWFAAQYRSFNHCGEAQAAIQRSETCDALLLDDIGKQYDTGHKVCELFRLVNLRYNEMRSTSFTSNFSPEELGKRMVASVGEQYASDIAAMVDRIRETCTVVEIKGTSWRRRAK